MNINIGFAHGHEYDIDKLLDTIYKALLIKSEQKVKQPKPEIELPEELFDI